MQIAIIPCDIAANNINKVIGIPMIEYFRTKSDLPTT